MTSDFPHIIQYNTYNVPLGNQGKCDYSYITNEKTDTWVKWLDQGHMSNTWS